uniref:Reverse transcriptase domain-containing protein n=1 Tax=Tanacetum cinerariifolium TaxID=118510 RepID=A0A6L2MWL5_TANCI|nr:hypothetical protein [Tanacetum cinerariifolium]
MLRACPHHGFSELTRIDTFYNGITEQDQDSLNATSGGNLLNKTTREALKIIENKSTVRYSRSKSNFSRVNTSSRDIVSKTDDRIDKLADQISNLVEIVNKQVIAPAKAVKKICVTCRCAHAYYDCIATDSNQPSVCAATGSYNQINVLRGDFNKQEDNLRRKLNNDMRSILGSFFQNQSSTSGTLPSNIMPNPKGEMKAVTTRSGLAYEGLSIPTNSPLEKVVEQNTKEIMDKEHSNCPGSTAQIQPPVVPISIPETDVMRTQTKPTIPYPSSFADALLLMPKFSSTIKSLLANKDKLFELAKVSLNENCSAMLPKKLPEKLGDSGASINLMPFSIWKKLSLPELTPTRMTLELADSRSKSSSNLREIILENQTCFNRCIWSGNYPQEFVQDNTKSSNPTLVSESGFCMEPIVKSSSPKLTPFGESDFFLEIEDFLNDDLIPTGMENSFYDPEGDILYLENFLNEDPFQFPPMNLKQTKSPIEEPEYSLSLGYEHLSTTSETKLDEVAESSTKNLVPIPSEYEVTLDNESEYNEPIKYDSSPAFIAFSNPLFDCNDDFTSNDNELISDEEVLIEEFKVYSNPLFDNDEINSNEIDLHCLNVESNFVESLSNHDALIDSSPKFDYIKEFSGALMPTSIADEERIRREHEEYISLIERLFTINPCPRLMKNANTIVESLPSSPIPVQDSDSQREEIDIFTGTDELLPPSFENDEYDLEGEIYVLEELLVDNSIPCFENKLSDFDHDNLSFLHPPLEPSDVEFDFKPNSGEVISAVMNNNDELIDDECFDPGGEIDVFTNVEDDDYFPFMFVIQSFLPYLIYPEVSPLLISAESEDTIFDPGISV